MQPQWRHGLINREMTNPTSITEAEGEHYGDWKELLLWQDWQNTTFSQWLNSGVYPWVISCIQTHAHFTVLVFIYVWEWLRVLFYVPTLTMISPIVCDHLHSTYFQFLPPKLLPSSSWLWHIPSSIPQGVYRVSRCQPGNSSTDVHMQRETSHQRLCLTDSASFWLCHQNRKRRRHS